MGHRIAKHVYNSSTWILEKSTYYILDAQGNQLSMYEFKLGVSRGAFTYYLKERNIYGSQRLGTTGDTVNMVLTNTLPSYGFAGNRSYELTNHLGNVLTSISDLVYPISSGGTDVDYYRVGINQVTDYSPFGVQLDGRTISGGIDGNDVRYGYQGSERDDAVKGSGNSYTTEFRQLDPRLGRWLSIDPKASSMPWQSPYCSMDNNPIWFNDQKGDITDKEEDKLRKEQKHIQKRLDQLSKKQEKWVNREAKRLNGDVIKGQNNGVSTYKVSYTDKDGDAGVSFNKDLENKIKKNSDRNNEITNLVEGFYYNAGDLMGIGVSVGYDMYFGGGISGSIDFIMLGGENCLGGTFGGGLGAGIDAQFIYCTTPGRYRAKDIQEGEGWEFSVAFGPLSYSRSGDRTDSEFYWNGETSTGVGGSLSGAMDKASWQYVYQTIGKTLVNTVKCKGSIKYEWNKSAVWKNW